MNFTGLKTRNAIEKLSKKYTLNNLYRSKQISLKDSCLGHSKQTISSAI